jgi:hypothetical protein
MFRLLVALLNVLFLISLTRVPGGARFFEGARVDKVLTKNGGVVGVRMENGHVIEVTRRGSQTNDQSINVTNIMHSLRGNVCHLEHILNWSPMKTR